MKHFLLVTAVVLGFVSPATAQKTYDFLSVYFEDSEGDLYYPLGVFYNTSPNGKYAVGCDNAQVNCYESYLWCVDEPDSLLIINVEPTRISTVDVSNDGTIVGSFEDRGDDLDTKAVAYPAYRTLDGTWTTLPVPDTYSTYQGKYNSFAEEARAITPDNKYIVGNLHLIVGYNSTWGWDIVYPTPVLWELSDTGYVVKDVFYGLGHEGMNYLYNNGELVLQDSMYYHSFYVYDISRDGSLIAGVNTAASGGQNPALIDVTNRKLIQLFDCGEYGVTEYEYLNFNGGICNSIDVNNNVYGYYVDYDASVKYFVYTAEGELIYYDDWYVCGTADGTKITQSFDDISYVQDCSDDGNIICGGGVTVLSTGLSVNYPLVRVMDATDGDTDGDEEDDDDTDDGDDTTDDDTDGGEEGGDTDDSGDTDDTDDTDDTTAISRLDAIKNNVGISYNRGSVLYINGQYQQADLYDITGSLVATGKQGKTFDTGNLPTGTYVVKVTTSKGVKTYKIYR